MDVIYKNGININNIGVISPSWEIGGILLSTGKDYVDPTKLRNSNYIDVSRNKTIEFIINNNAYINIIYYNEKQEFIGNTAVTKSSITTIPDNVKYLRIQVRDKDASMNMSLAYIKDITILNNELFIDTRNEISDARIGMDDKTYPTIGEAIRGQINGITSVIDGIGIAYAFWEIGGISLSNGNNFATDTKIRSSFIDVNGIDSVDVFITNGAFVNILYYASDKTFISNVGTSLSSRIDMPDNAAYIRIQVRDSDTSKVIDLDYLHNIAILRDGLFRELYNNSQLQWYDVAFDSLNPNTFIQLNSDYVFYNELNRVKKDETYSSILIPIKKGEKIMLKTNAGTVGAKAFAKVKHNYLIDYIYTDSSYFNGVIEFEYDGFLAVNVRNDYSNKFICKVFQPAYEMVRNSQFKNALDVSNNFMPTYDDDNICRVLCTGASMMGSIHHWGIIGASYDSGEFNFLRDGATPEQKSSVDYYEYSWGQILKRINGIPDLYNYSNGGQNAKEWFTTGNDYFRSHHYTQPTEETSLIWNDGKSTVSGICVDTATGSGGSWWKLKEDIIAGKGKQAYAIVLGSNDINNNNPHDSETWAELDTFDETKFYKCGTVADIGTYNKATDSDVLPSGKKAGVIPNVVNSYCAYIGAILNRLIAWQPDCKIFLATIRNHFGWNANSVAIWEEYNNAIREITTLPQYKNNVYLIDYGKYGYNYHLPESNYMFLGAHPNALGYVWAAYHYNTLIDYAIKKNLKDFKQSMFIGTDKKY